MRKRYAPALFEDFGDLWPTGSVNRMMRNMLGSSGFDEEIYAMPRVDFYRKEGKLIVEAELPGIDPKDVDLHVYRDRVNFSAEKKSERKEGGEGEAFLRAERWYGKIERSVAFPVEVNPDTAKASFKNGVLTIEVEENVKPQGYKKVEIQGE